MATNPKPREMPPFHQPPANHEAEMALLGALLTDNRTLEQASEIVRPEHFADDRHGRIYTAIETLVERGTNASPITLKNYFEQDDGLAEIGGTALLTALAGATVSLRNVKDYARAIADAYLLRQILGTMQWGADLASHPELDKSAPTVLETIETQLFALAETGRVEQPVVTLGEAAGKALELADEAGKRGGGLVGITTGFIDLDRMTGGLEAGNVYVLAGRPSMGKTAAAIWSAWGTARTGSRVLYASLEMSAEQLGRRVAAAIAGVSIHDVKIGNLTENDWTKLLAVKRELGELPFLIDDRPGQSATAIRNRARRLKRRGGLGLIVVDHLQLMRLGTKIENRRLEIGAITSGLKALAKDLGVPVLLLSQLSRAVEQREDKRPTLSDLRESGDIEQDADVVMFVYREHYYAEREKPARKAGEDETKFNGRFVDWEQRVRDCRGKAEIIVAKQRDGAIGSVEMAFDDNTARFQNLHRGTT